MRRSWIRLRPKEVGRQDCRIENGTPTIVADGPNSPATDVKFRDGEMYAAQRHAVGLSKRQPDGSITDLPSETTHGRDSVR